MFATTFGAFGMKKPRKANLKLSRDLVERSVFTETAEVSADCQSAMISLYISDVISALSKPPVT